MGFSIKFSEEKNQLLKVTRNISFEEIIDALEKDNLLADIAHPGVKRAHQHIYVVRVGGYAYAVPYVINLDLNIIFLKTIYPSRALTKLYIRKGEQDE
jgi:hypothetical protein